MGCVESTEAGATGSQTSCPAHANSSAADASQKTTCSTDSPQDKPQQQQQQEEQQQRGPSLFDRLGGDAAVAAAVEIFYKRIKSDPKLCRFFARVDFELLQKKQEAFLKFAFGGSTAYTGRPLYAVHRKLVQDKGLQECHFDVVVSHLVATLEQLGTPRDLISEVERVVMPAKDTIFGTTYALRRLPCATASANSAAAESPGDTRPSPPAVPTPTPWQ